MGSLYCRFPLLPSLDKPREWWQDTTTCHYVPSRMTSISFKQFAPNFNVCQFLPYTAVNTFPGVMTLRILHFLSGASISHLALRVATCALLANKFNRQFILRSAFLISILNFTCCLLDNGKRIEPACMIIKFKTVGFSWFYRKDICWKNWLNKIIQFLHFSKISLR